jgi:hypothetical protein
MWLVLTLVVFGLLIAALFALVFTYRTTGKRGRNGLKGDQGETGDAGQTGSMGPTGSSSLGDSYLFVDTIDSISGTPITVEPTRTTIPFDNSVILNDGWTLTSTTISPPATGIYDISIRVPIQASDPVTNTVNLGAFNLYISDESDLTQTLPGGFSALSTSLPAGTTFAFAPVTLSLKATLGGGSQYRIRIATTVAALDGTFSIAAGGPYPSGCTLSITRVQ